MKIKTTSETIHRTISCTVDDLIAPSDCSYFNSIRTFILEGKNAYEWMASLSDEEVCKIRNMELPDADTIEGLFGFSYTLSRFFGIWQGKTEISLKDIKRNCLLIKSLAQLEQINRIAKKYMGERLVVVCYECGKLPFNLEETKVKFGADPSKCLRSTREFLDEVRVDPELLKMIISLLKKKKYAENYIF